MHTHQLSSIIYRYLPFLSLSHTHTYMYLSTKGFIQEYMGSLSLLHNDLVGNSCGLLKVIPGERLLDSSVLHYYHSTDHLLLRTSHPLYVTHEHIVNGKSHISPIQAIQASLYSSIVDHFMIYHCLCCRVHPVSYSGSSGRILRPAPLLAGHNPAAPFAAQHFCARKSFHRTQASGWDHLCTPRWHQICGRCCSAAVSGTGKGGPCVHEAPYVRLPAHRQYILACGWR